MAQREPPGSAALGAFISETVFEDVPDAAVRLAERCFIDTVGVTLAGATEGAGATAAAIAEEGSTTLLGREETATLAEAALVNGTAGHGLDFDDVSWGMDGHPSVTLAAPALAVGERIDATGRDLLTAFITGFETECALAAPISPGHYERGWHPTATFGTFGAAAVTASLLDLDERATQHALDIAASMPAGLKRNFGTMTKPLHVGQAVRSGVTAGQLADEGFTADSAAISGSGGFWDLYGGIDGVDRDVEYGLGKPWAVLEDGVHVKKYPCCYFTHTSIANAIDLVTEFDVEPDEVERIEVHASGGAVDALPHEDPTTELEAKFSMPHTVAWAVVHRRVGLAAFEESAHEDSAVDALRDHVSLSVDPELHYDAHESRMSLETTDGDVYERVRENPPGTHEDPLSLEELRVKYEMCAERALEPAAVADSWAALDDLRSQPSTRALVNTL
jgi:2-methylcitrate dehydratase PrpD